MRTGFFFSVLAALADFVTGFVVTLFCSVGFVVSVGFVDSFGFALATSTGFGVLEGFTMEVSSGLVLPSGWGDLEFSFGFTRGVGAAGVGGLAPFTSTFSGSGLAFTSGLGVGFATPGLLMILPDSLGVPEGCFGCVVVPFCGAVGRLLLRE